MKDRYFIGLVLINIAVVIFRILYIVYYPTDLAPDEALYWDYSRHPQISYYAKPPLIAYIIYLSTALFGNTELGVRIPAVLMSALTSIVIYKLALYLFNDRRLAFLSGLLPMFSVGFQLLGVLMTIDTPLSMFWVASLFFYAKAFRENKNIYWMFAGFFGMLAFLSKYTGIFLPILAFLFAVWSNRDKLKEKGIYISLALTLVGFIPVVLWNFLNDWVGFKHVFTLAGLSEKSIPERGGFNPFRIIDFFGGQILITGISFFPYIVFAFFKFSKSIDLRHRMLIVFSLPIFLFFLLLSLFTKVEANWPSFGYFAVIPLIALIIFNTIRKFKYIHISALFIALILTLLTHFTPIIDRMGLSHILPPEKDPHARLVGWKELGIFVSNLIDNNMFIFSDKYQITSELAFYVKGNPETFCINRGRRMNQYDLWKYKMSQYLGKDAVFVSYTPIDESILSGFEGVGDKKVFSVMWRGKEVKHFYVYVLKGYKGGIKESDPKMY